VYGAVALVVNIAEGGSDEGISALHKAIQVGPQEPEAQGFSLNWKLETDISLTKINKILSTKNK